MGSCCYVKHSRGQAIGGQPERERQQTIVLLLHRLYLPWMSSDARIATTRYSNYAKRHTAATKRNKPLLVSILIPILLRVSLLLRLSVVDVVGQSYQSQASLGLGRPLVGLAREGFQYEVDSYAIVHDL